jgi:predicted methyltransferase
MHRKAARLLLVFAVGLLAACAVSPTTRSTTSSQLDAILAGSHRAAANRARDAHRNPRQTLLFFGIRPEMTVVEIAPAAGWYTEVIAPLLRERGRYVAALSPLDPSSENSRRQHENFRRFLDAAPGALDKVEIAPFTPGERILPDGTADMVLTFRNVHSWMARGAAERAFDSMYRALKPGGVLGVVEHRGNPQVPQDPQARTGYVNQAYAVRLIEAAGFRLVATAEINANPRDTKDYPDGVWTLPPVYARRDADREQYAAIGESDRFTLKFEKPRR